MTDHASAEDMLLLVAAAKPWNDGMNERMTRMRGRSQREASQKQNYR